MRFLFVILLLCILTRVHAQDSTVVIQGTVWASGETLEGAGIRESGSSRVALSDKKGVFTLRVNRHAIYRLVISHLGYESQIKTIRDDNSDSLRITIRLTRALALLDTVSVVAVHKPETLVGKPNYSIHDFDFYEDKLILLTATKNLKDAQLRLSDYHGKILATYQIPKSAGEALHFHHDYMGYTELICKDSIFRLDVIGNDLLMYTVPKADFENYLKPVQDSSKENVYYHNQWEKYPAFNYYSKNIHDSLSVFLRTISNQDLMKLYNLEYYYLPSRMQLEARRIAEYYKTDRKIVAALMSGFTNSIYYEPLYAPLFVLNDTVCVFNHYSDYVYRYMTQNTLIDSVPIHYHHPKNWKEWKKQLFVDEARNQVYALFSKDGHFSLKRINPSTGREELTYKLKHHSASKLKLKDGFVYYVYRPFDSTQELFLYREKIE